MRYAQITTAVLFAILSAAACSDAPTEPDAVAVGAAGPSNAYILEPVIVKGKCDPIMSIDWCGGSAPGDGECMTDAGDSDLQFTSGCYSGGGGSPTGPGGGGGGGGTGPGTPSSDPWKQFQEDIGWHCPGCGERAPTPAEKTTMEGLLSGVTCPDGKSTLTTMLGDGSIQVYSGDNGLYGAWDSNTQRIYISRAKHWDPATGAVNGPELTDTMVHEVVHKLLGHVNGPQRHDEEWKNKMAACGFPQT